jgi:hypothetical protein
VVALRVQVQALTGVLQAVNSSVRALRAAAGVVVGGHAEQAEGAYTTLWLALELDIADSQGERAVLTRRQRVHFLSADATLVRELVWGDGEQLVRYTARGAQRAGQRAEGSKHALLLLPHTPPTPGDRLTITSRRTIRGGFRQKDEYCEAYLERPTGRLDLVVRFPVNRPPRAASLVSTASMQVLRGLRPCHGPDGRAVLRCRVRQPAPRTTYSLRWSW